MIVDAIIVGLLFYFTFPLLTSYCAHQYGRSFALWFGIGCILPLVSFFILFVLISWDEKTTPRTKLSRREEAESEFLVKNLLQDIEKRDVTTPDPRYYSKQRS